MTDTKEINRLREILLHPAAGGETAALVKQMATEIAERDEMLADERATVVRLREQCDAARAELKESCELEASEERSGDHKHQLFLEVCDQRDELANSVRDTAEAMRKALDAGLARGGIGVVTHTQFMLFATRLLNGAEHYSPAAPIKHGEAGAATKASVDDADALWSEMTDDAGCLRAYSREAFVAKLTAFRETAVASLRADNARLTGERDRLHHENNWLARERDEARAQLAEARRERDELSRLSDVLWAEIQDDHRKPAAKRRLEAAMTAVQVANDNLRRHGSVFAIPPAPSTGEKP